MAKIILGSTGITLEQNGFGALPIQRNDKTTAVSLLRKAFEGGMTFFDTSRFYTDSEEKIGLAFHDRKIRDQIYIATKTRSQTPKGFWEDLETSLEMLQTDYIDIYQFHLAPICYKPGDGSGMYEAMLKAKEQGKIRHIGLTAHSLAVAQDCVDSHLYETLQFSFSYLAGEKEMTLVKGCKEHNMGYLAMKALAGGLINNAAAAYAYIAQFDNVLPIWGIQHEWELDEFLKFMNNPPSLNDVLNEVIAKDRLELSGDFCRSCGYCLPCPAEIDIAQCARMSLLMRRSPYQPYLKPEWQEKMKRIEDCQECGRCKKRCPYGLDTPNLLRKNYEDYQKILAGEISVD
jgi:predicted aldo/keto reductase-like oxidoreductase